MRSYPSICQGAANIVLRNCLHRLVRDRRDRLGYRLFSFVPWCLLRRHRAQTRHRPTTATLSNVNIVKSTTHCRLTHRGRLRGRRLLRLRLQIQLAEDRGDMMSVRLQRSGCHELDFRLVDYLNRRNREHRRTRMQKQAILALLIFLGIRLARKLVVSH